MDKQTVINQEKENVLGVYGRPEFVIERGEGSTLYDSDGKAYLDCVSGIAVVSSIQVISITLRPTHSLPMPSVTPASPTKCISVSVGPMPMKAHLNLLAAMPITKATAKNITFWPSAMHFMDGSLAASLPRPAPSIKRHSNP